MAPNMSHATRDLDTQQNAAGGVSGLVKSSRRPPAHRSVSLKHSSPAPAGRETTTNVATAALQQLPPGKAFSTASSLINHKASSGESSNADTWFDRSNKNAARGSRAEDGDDSPPFFVQYSSTDTSNHPGHSLSLPFRSMAPHLDSMGSSSEEYRSVIDDLTIQNKRLKKRLKGYERFRDRNVESEAMFEVKMRGLSREKKRELEKLLADFALNANVKRSSTLRRADSTSTAQFGARLEAQHSTKPSSSLTSTRAADSGYGSMSTSQQGSNSRGTDSTNAMVGPDVMKQRDRSIHSYLHDIPEGLLPKPPNVMTEKAKKKLVVERLEQIFGGRGASVGGHQQPIQQQKVSTSAAEDDRKALEALGNRATEEGQREAVIMNEETEEPMDFSKDESSPNNSGSGANTTDPTPNDIQPLQHVKHHRKDKQTNSEEASDVPEQRPTRPLDLDPHRAQIPLENMDYLRHLGFDIPVQETTARAMTDEQGWIYLNVMINMAQLHTVNVTTELVRHAVKDYSKMFELSPDGRKIRWKGFQDVSHLGTSSSSGAEQSAHSSIDDLRQQNVGDKRPRPADLTESLSGQKSSYASKRPAQDKYQYTPIFRRQLEEDDDEDVSMDEDAYDSSPLPEHLTGESSALATSSKLTGSGSRSRRQDDGPLVFYRDRHFFIDLSADRIKPASPTHSLGSRSNAPNLLGTKVRSIRNKSSLAGSATATYERRYFSHSTTQPPYHSEARKMASANDTDIRVESDAFSPKHVTFVEPDDVISFEVSGVAGIQPKDNMAFQVVRGIATKFSPEPVRRVSSRLDRVLKPKRRYQTATEKIMSVRKQDLEPSKLPPPSFAYSPEDGSDVEEYSDDGSDSDEDGFDVADVAAQPVAFGPSPNGSDEDESMEDESEESDVSDDDQSLDFLASARAANPAAVYAREREYDAAMAERLAEEIPAGSSAATAGGGSGFNSPVDVSRGQDARARTSGSSSKKQRRARSVSS